MIEALKRAVHRVVAFFRGPHGPRCPQCGSTDTVPAIIDGRAGFECLRCDHYEATP